MKNNEIIVLNSADIEVKGENKLGERVADMYTGSLSENTKRAYIRDIKDFFQVDDLKDITIAAIQNVDVATANQFRERLLSEGKAISTVNRKLTSMSSFYRLLCRREVGVMDYNPFDSNEGNKRLRQNKRYSNTRSLTKEEVQKIVKATEMEDNDLIAIRNRIIILLMATTGVRREEIAGIKVGHFTKNMGQDVVEIIGKGDKERYVVVSGTLMTLIGKYLEMRGITWKNKDEFLIVKHTTNSNFYDKQGVTTQTIYNVVKSIADKAGVDAESISPHCFRHTFATLARESGVELPDLADMMGHTDLSTTRRYEHTNRVVTKHPATTLTDMFLD